MDKHDWNTKGIINYFIQPIKTNIYNNKILV